ncbi:membrane protease YdiL (CAAX protease family) [Microlunatus panaciterrae]|uniref:Membrane protease YdiL (CAAX protease family) n=1 Tax=Microlunatus panaciterrae TaxID=400768 RepID=A0ABS2RIF4_9ACTN|nr:membrane protease YdiL (CAAX protease family) [Microlunatus panaciterrae]
MLVDKVPRDHLQSDAAFRRRRIVVVIVLVAGAALLGVSLSVPPGATAFYPLTFGLAALWAVGAFASGRLHLGRIPFRGSLRRPIISPVILGLVAAAVFVAGALVIREIPLLRDFTDSVLDHARSGSLPLVLAVTVVNGVAEELFFRGALFAAIGVRHPVLISTLVYALATLATGNPMLVFAALLLGLVLGLQRRASGGILGPIITHVTWSTTMLLLLPLLIRSGG